MLRVSWDCCTSPGGGDTIRVTSESPVKGVSLPDPWEHTHQGKDPGNSLQEARWKPSQATHRIASCLACAPLYVTYILYVTGAVRWTEEVKWFQNIPHPQMTGQYNSLNTSMCAGVQQTWILPLTRTEPRFLSVLNGRKWPRICSINGSWSWLSFEDLVSELSRHLEASSGPPQPVFLKSDQRTVERLGSEELSTVSVLIFLELNPRQEPRGFQLLRIPGSRQQCGRVGTGVGQGTERNSSS